MADYISREAVIEILRRQYAGTWRGNPVYSDDIRAAIKAVEALPAAAVQPVKRGEWKSYFDGKEIECSVCSSTFWNENQEAGPKYCPSCGCKMVEK